MKVPTKLLLTCAAALALAAATPSALAAEPRIIVGVNQSNPPFILPESESGLQVDIIRAAFASQSVPVEFKFLPPLRVALAFKTGFIAPSQSMIKPVQYEPTIWQTGEHVKKSQLMELIANLFVFGDIC